jgi:drug/metabolite transporter (DMT)-like permease
LPSRLLLVLAAVLFSTGGAAIKFNQLTAWQVACGRSIVAAGALWLAIPEVRRRWTWRLVLIGLAYAANLILFVAATKLTTAANAIFLQSTAPFYLLIIGPVFLKEHLRRSDLLLMAAMVCGMSLFFVSTEPAAVTAPNPALGNALGAISGLAWATVVTGLRWTGRKDKTGTDGLSTVFAGNLIAFLVALGPALPARDAALSDGLVILYLGTCQVALAYYCLTKGIRHVPAFEASTVMLVEPALNPVWTWLMLSERPSLLACIGGGILLGATAINAWWQNRSQESPFKRSVRPSQL